MQFEDSRKLPGRRRVKSVLLGLGLDGDDGHTRVTRGENVCLLGGSEDTHANMQEKTVKLSEELKRRGKTIGSASAEELRNILQDLHEK